ncbi:HAD-IA family hydrolase [Micromonospora sp. CPCC 206061]|uniref:HAD-IA family hydrolase n=1 Tax=Micromonospora sp. CPCC 206061 TaxID=3122410 RepID=UPI003FA53E5D
MDAALRVQVEPTPGLVEVLDRLDIPVCLASNGRPEKVTLTLEMTGLARYFAGRVFTAADVERCKPAPDLFLLAASRMGAPPGRCVVVEDSETGVAAARAAGMRVVRYASDGGLPLDASEATFRRMAELPALLDGRPVDAVSRDAL